jgi:hypothetical protein
VPGSAFRVHRVRREAGGEHSSPALRLRHPCWGDAGVNLRVSDVGVAVPKPSGVGFEGEEIRFGDAAAARLTAAPRLFPRARAPKAAAGEAVDKEGVEEVPAAPAELPRWSLWGMWEAASSPPSSTSST